MSVELPPAAPNGDARSPPSGSNAARCTRCGPARENGEAHVATSPFSFSRVLINVQIAGAGLTPSAVQKMQRAIPPIWGLLYGPPAFVWLCCPT